MQVLLQKQSELLPTLKQVQAASLIIAHRYGQLDNRSMPLAWRNRLPLMYPNYIWHEFSPPHTALWDWANDITEDSTPRPFIAIWPRNRGKSTHAEIVAADMGARGKRKYCLYVCMTQEQADKHIYTINNMLESDTVASYAPDVGIPKIGKHGARNWRRNIMVAENGYTVEAAGLA